jgi:hypothetical protein
MGMTQVVVHLPNICKGLSSNPNTNPPKKFYTYAPLEIGHALDTYTAHTDKKIQIHNICLYVMVYSCNHNTSETEAGGL